MATPSVSQVFTLLRDTQDLYRLQAAMKDALSQVNDRLRAVEDRLTRLETEQHQVVTEARSAATGAASMITGGIISDAVTRITRIEEGLRRLEQTGPSAHSTQQLQADSGGDRTG